MLKKLCDTKELSLNKYLPKEDSRYIQYIPVDRYRYIYNSILPKSFKTPSFLSDQDCVGMCVCGSHTN